MALKRTLYEVLGVGRKASAEEVAAAWQGISAGNPDQASLALAREAQRILSDPAQRAAYDASLVASAARALASDGTGRRRREETEEKASSRTPLIMVVVLGIAVAAGFWLWQARTPTTGSGGIVSREVIQLKQTPGAPVPERPAAPQAAIAQSAPVSASPVMSPEELFARLSGSVALVTARGAGSGASGSGVVIDREAVITNCHVVRRGAEINVRVAKRNYPATLVVADDVFDLCRLSVAGLDAAAVTVGSVADLRTGQKVFAIGAPQGLELSLSDGLVSSLRDIPGGTVIQTTAPISPGSSGGGLFDASGRLVGIMTFQHRYGQNLNFAVPADWIAEMRARDGTARAASAVAGPQAAAGPTIVGRWSCFGASTGQSGEWAFGEDGGFAITRSGSSPRRGRYQLRGRTLQIGGGGDVLRLELESLTEERMVLDGGGGNRVACDRRG
ncbi:MAG: trypsin-like peptidase domain-containing protein [Betaproteobacteria bacterium]